MEETPKINFEDRKSLFFQQSMQRKKQYDRIAVLRVLFFLAGVIVGIVLINSHLTGWLLLFVPGFIAVFAWLVNFHNKIKFKKRLEDLLCKINEEELLRLRHQLAHFDEGSEFLEESHPYVYDLDIFGRNSIFQLLNRTGTNTGKNVLAKWLMERAGHSEIIKRQQAIAEIKSQIDWRQRFEAYGRLDKSAPENAVELHKWLSEKDVINNSSVFRIFKWIGPVFSLIILYLVIINVFTYHVFILWLIVNSAFLAKTYKYAKETHEKTNKSLQMLLAYEHMIKMIEVGEFNSDLLKSLQAKLMTDEYLASTQINKLKNIFSFFDNRPNMLYGIFDVIFLIDFWLLSWAENWRARLKDNLLEWFKSVGEFEGINSIGGFSYANSTFTFPDISDDVFTFESKNIGHPLIPVHERVNNDFSLTGRGNIALITGSNMAGKSTFLRTVGVNTVLALMGAPVCASQLTLSCFLPYTSMRTKDNLEENVSSFYAELLRIRGLLKLSIDMNPYFFCSMKS